MLTRTDLHRACALAKLNFRDDMPEISETLKSPFGGKIMVSGGGNIMVRGTRFRVVKPLRLA